MGKKPYAIYIFLAFAGLTARAQNIDSMQHVLDTTQNICIKLDMYTQLSAGLIQFNQPETHTVTYAEAGKAVDYVLKAIHINAEQFDTLALRDNFDCISQAYFIQKKYTQAKWFNLQSNAISRDIHDVPHIITSLMQMATIKTAIKDYKLALKDLNEAIVLCKYTYNLPRQIEVEKHIAVVYDKAGDVKSAVATVNHYTLLADNLHKLQQPRVAATPKPKTKAKTYSMAQETKQAIVAQKDQSIETKLNIENGIWAVKD